jgi:hypothetical protein
MYSERLTKLKLEIVCNNTREKRDPCFLSFIKGFFIDPAISKVVYWKAYNAKTRNQS